MQAPDGGSALYRTHRLGVLYAAVEKLIETHRAWLEANTRPTWIMRKETRDAIAYIDRVDGTSTYLRYPEFPYSSKGADKEQWHQVATVVAPSGTPESRGKDAIEVFSMGDTPLQELMEKVEAVANELYGLHAMVRAEVCGGR